MDRLPADLARNWGWILLRGIVSILFGLIAFARPGASILAIVFVWGVYALADGVIALIAAFRVRNSKKPIWPFVLIGVLGVGAGITALLMPVAVAAVLLACIAAWAIVVGILQLVAAVRLRKVIEREWLLALSGVLSVGFGVLLLRNPVAGAVSILWLIASFAIVFGILLVALALRLKRHDSGPVTFVSSH